MATGYVHVPSEAVRDLESGITKACADAGFPEGPEGEFKWSPGRELWMRDNLVDQDRTEFFLGVLELASTAGTSVAVIIDDESHGTATGCDDHSVDVTRLLIERVEWRLSRVGRHGIVVADRPSGARADESKFLSECLETITTGTDYVTPERIAINVVSTPSRLVRCLQLADLVISATTSFVAGESRWAPTLFPVIRALMPSENGRVGGVGLKLQPDFVYANLYHWFLEDEVLVRRNTGLPLPSADYPYAGDPAVY